MTIPTEPKSTNHGPITYGAVYFRKSNPPREDWARDYQTAVADGMNTFRHWFLWSAIETAPGEYDWDDYDRQMDLAAKHGIKTIIAELTKVAPEWAFRRHADGRLETRGGVKLDAQMNPSCNVGGAPGLCLDHDEVKEAAGKFLEAMVTRYRDHPGLGGYDLWNECFMPPDTCYCPATAEKFRRWLQNKYGDVKALGRAWHRYGHATWEDVMPPRYIGPYRDVMDWLEFRVDVGHELLRWRVELIRRLDPNHPITAHGLASTFNYGVRHACDDWVAAAEVESYGFTWVACRQGDEPWKHLHAADLIRAASRGKPFWHAEAQGGPLWMQPQVIGQPREGGRIPTADDVRYWNMISLMAGATGILYPRWRPLLNGPLFGAFGPYAMDGSRTERSIMAGRIAQWANAPSQAPLWRSRPVRGEVGIVYVPQTAHFLFAQQGKTDLFAQAMRGAYRGFMNLHLQPDWVHIDDIQSYRVLYLPCPVMLTQDIADRLRHWVGTGGTLIAEGCPGYWDDRTTVCTTQPGLGLDELFGVTESCVAFTPDLLGDLRLNIHDQSVWGGWCLQTYTPTTGKAIGWCEDGRVAAVENQFDQGRTMLIGTLAGLGYGAHTPDATHLHNATHVNVGASGLYDIIRQWADIDQHVTCSESAVIARLHDGPGGTFLWVANPTRRACHATLTLGDAWGPFVAAHTLWGGDAEINDRTVKVTVAARDAVVISLQGVR